MKKLFMTCGIIFSCYAVSAQRFTPIIRESNNSYNQQQQIQQQIRTITAYCRNQLTGEYYQVPIKVSIGDTIYIVAIYKSTAIGAMWDENQIIPVDKCSGCGYVEEFECRFSYKASVLTKTYYFDL